jgi:hypothetical protein
VPLRVAVICLAMTLALVISDAAFQAIVNR